MDLIPWVGLHDYVHFAEEFKFPMPSGKTAAIAGAVGIPVAVILHETTDLWWPTRFNLPVLSWFRRKWTDPETKENHLTTLRNASIFVFICCVMNEKLPKYMPLDYVSDRLTSSSSRRAVTSDILQARKAAFGAANAVLGEEAADEAKSRQQRDAALRRRHVKESRNQ